MSGASQESRVKSQGPERRRRRSVGRLLAIHANCARPPITQDEWDAIARAEARVRELLDKLTYIRNRAIVDRSPATRGRLFETEETCAAKAGL